MKKLTLFKLEPNHVKFLEYTSIGLDVNRVFEFNIKHEEIDQLLEIKNSNKKLSEGIYYKEDGKNTWKILPKNPKF